jgi:pilus assembly protein CpaB
MRNKSLYLLVACVCGTVAAIVASQWLKAQANSQGTVSTTEIFVAAVAIDIGEKITPEKIQLEQWPADKVPQGSTNDLAALENKYARQRFYAGEAIMPVKLMEENWSTVPKGFRVVAMKASDVTIANLVQPGDRVDVMAYFSRSELIPRSMTKTVLQGVRVYALDGDTERKVGEDRPKSLRTIQLLIHEKDAEAWTYANELGKVRLSLGSDADYSNDDGSNEAGQEFLAWLEEHRKQQEDAQRRQEEERQLSATKPAIADPQPATQPKQENGFSMFKMVEGRMVEYWIVPGKLPVMIGETGGQPGAEAGTGSATSDAGPATTTTPASDYDYLNGEASPFFQVDDEPLE